MTTTRLFMLLLLGVLLVPMGATAQPAAEAEEARDPALDQIAQLNEAAKAAFASYSYRSAQRKLESALALAEDKRLLEKPEIANTYMLLGVTAVAGFNDLYRGLHYFALALRLDPKAEVPKDFATPQLVKMHKKAAKALKIVGKPPTIKITTRRTKTAEQMAKQKKEEAALGLVHSPVDTAKRNFPIPITARPGIDVQSSKLMLYFRPAGTVKYLRTMMVKKTGLFRANIPAPITKGRYVHYYIEAVDARGRRAASHGSERGPNVIIIK